MARPRNEDRVTDRTERVPFGVARKKLEPDAGTMDKYKGKTLRWVKDADNRIIEAQRGGYEFVTADGGECFGGEATEADRRIKKLGNKSSRSGMPENLYLMAIDDAFYKEDQAKKEAVNRTVDEAIYGGSPPGLQSHGVRPDQGGTTIKTVDYQP